MQEVPLPAPVSDLAFAATVGISLASTFPGRNGANDHDVPIFLTILFDF